MKYTEIISEDLLHPTLEEFLTGSVTNVYVTFVSSKGIKLESYVRKGPRYIGGERFDKVLDLANTKLKSSRLQMKMHKAGVQMANTGAYREFDAHMVELAKQYGYDGIYVENVLNPDLHEVLIRYGYTLVPNTEPKSYWKPLK